MFSDVDAFLNRDDSDLIQTIVRELQAHIASIDGGVSGYAVLTGDDTSVTHLMAAYSPGDSSSNGSDRFDVHAWEMCPGTFAASDDKLEKLNAEFDRLYPVGPPRAETDETQDAHVAKLHDSIINAMVTAKAGVPDLQKDSSFSVFTIPDSMLDVDVRSSQLLNSAAVHSQYSNWR